MVKSKLEKMLEADGWKLKYYTNCGVKYFAWHKNGFTVDWNDFEDDDKFRDWRDA